MRALLVLFALAGCFTLARASSPSEMSEISCDALELGELLEFTYHGDRRLVEVHVVGETKDGVSLVRAWQINGPGDDPEGWRSFHTNEISDAVVRDALSGAPRPGYNIIDPAIFAVDCKV